MVRDGGILKSGVRVERCSMRARPRARAPTVRVFVSIPHACVCVRHTWQREGERGRKDEGEGVRGRQ